MTEHRIRLRGGWECRAAGSPEIDAKRLSLPVRWAHDEPRRLILTRRFGRPALDPLRQVLLLQMDQVQGILSLLLNGQRVALTSAEFTNYEIELPNLPERNLLTVELDASACGSRPGGADREWGMISLVIRTSDSADKP